MTALRVLLSLAVAGLLLALLLVWGDVRPADVVAAARRLPVELFAAALAVQATIYVLRGLRLAVLLPEEDQPDRRVLAAASAAWILDSHVVPAKLGELSLVLHLRRAGVPAAHGVVGLVASRALDLATIVAALSLTCLGLGLSDVRPDLEWLIPTGAALAVPAVLLAWGVWHAEAVAALALAFLHALRLDRTLLGARVLRFAGRVKGALASTGRRRLARAALWSVPVWLAVLGVYVILARGLGLGDLPLGALLFGASLAILGSLLPVSGFLGFGMLDVGWVAGFTALGVERELAVESGLAFHLVYLLNVGLLGALGHVGVAWLGKRPRAGDAEEPGG